MFGINGGEFVVLLIVALIIIGPERLPGYAEQLGRLARQARGMLQDARTRVQDELGDDFSEVDWSKLDPRQYDPRRIVREALFDDPVAPGGSGPNSASTAPVRPAVAKLEGPAPFDDEAT